MIHKRDLYGLMIWKRDGESDWRWGICLLCAGEKKWFEGSGPKQELSVYDGEALLKVSWDDKFNLTSHDCELTYAHGTCPPTPKMFDDFSTWNIPLAIGGEAVITRVSDSQPEFFVGIADL